MDLYSLGNLELLFQEWMQANFSNFQNIEKFTFCHILPIVEEIHRLQARMKRLRAAYNNAYGNMHSLSRNVSVCPQQVSHRVTTFDTLLKNNLYRFLQRSAS